MKIDMAVFRFFSQLENSMKKIGIGFLFLMSLDGFIWAQEEKSVQVSFLPVFGKNPVSSKNSFFKLESGDSLHLEILKFYISEIQFLNNETVVWQESASFHLVDLEYPESMNISMKGLKNRNYNQIRFRFGIDSSTNCSGAMSGDLDPTKGMYWTWDNGYINAKIEGKCNRCLSRNQEFQWHVGGYRNGVNTSRVITLKVKQGTIIQIQFDLQPVLNGFDLAKNHHIMSAGKEGVAISNLFVQNFKTE